MVSHRTGLNCLSRPTPHYLFPGPIYPEIPETNRLGPRNWGLFLGGFRGVYGGYPRGSNLGVFLTPDLGVRGPPILGPARGRGCTIWRVFNNSPSRDKMGHFHFRVFRMIPHYTENGKKHDFREFAKFGNFPARRPGAVPGGPTRDTPRTPKFDPRETPKMDRKPPKFDPKLTPN